MADDASIPQPSQPPESKPETGNPYSQPDKPESISASPSSQPQPLSTPPPPLQPSPTAPVNPNPNPNPNSAPPLAPPPPPSVASINPFGWPAPIGSSALPPPSLPSFRPAGASIQALAAISTPQFAPVPPNPNLPNFPQPQQGPVGVPPPGVSSALGLAPPPHLVAVNMYQVPPGQPPNVLPRPHYGVMPNGYVPPGVPPGTIPPPGAPRYPYAPIVRPGFPPRPPGTMGLIPPISRPPVLGVRPPVVTTTNRPPLLPVITPAEKPQTTVYVGKIASTVEDDFMLSLLKFCGAVKSWKRAQDPSNGTPKGFGFCEFESAEGVLHALRLLTKFNVDGQELVLNFNQATREYLERYVTKKKEDLKRVKDTESEDSKAEANAANGEKRKGVGEDGLPKSSTEDSKMADNETGNKDNDIASFGLVNDEDHEADREALEKIKGAINERLKTRPLPLPPPPEKADVTAVLNSEMATKSGDRDSDIDGKKDEKYDDDMSSEVKSASTAGAESPDKGRRHDKRSRERDRERDMKREKERELERLERERERERARRERERELEIQKAERLYKERVKEWEAREKEKEYQRKYEKEREKEREHERRRLISDQEDESDDDSRRRRQRSDIQEKRKRRRRQNEEDLEDRLREEEEIAEAEKRAAEELERQKEREELQCSSAPLTNGTRKALSPETKPSEVGAKGGSEQMFDSDSGQVNHIGEGVIESGSNDDTVKTVCSASDARASGNAPAKKLGFGLVGSGKRAAVPSVFNEDDDDDAHKDKKMRPLVPIDYTTEELQAVQNDMPPNLAAAAEFAKRISRPNNLKEEKSDAAKDRSHHSQDRSSTHRGRDRNYDETGSCSRDESREKSVDREYGDRLKSIDDNKIMDAKQLIDMIPKTKDELFSYDINWAVYDKHGLHEKMRPWISRKITEFLGEEETTLVDYIVSSIQEHVKASQMLELLQSILDEEAEMFVLKMWRMLIYEIKRVETGLASSKSKA